jgi:hypothetical protein
MDIRQKGQAMEIKRDVYEEALSKLERLCNTGCEFRCINDEWAIFDEANNVVGKGKTLFLAILDASE